MQASVTASMEEDLTIRDDHFACDDFLIETESESLLLFGGSAGSGGRCRRVVIGFLPVLSVASEGRQPPDFSPFFVPCLGNWFVFETLFYFILIWFVLLTVFSQ